MRAYWMMTVVGSLRSKLGGFSRFGFVDFICLIEKTSIRVRKEGSRSGSFEVGKSSDFSGFEGERVSRRLHGDLLFFLLC